ncbi:hypothetical protein SBRCBS47491_007038 [Sporothrix bragantina]|uniref:Mif2/CENP-C cupin domain-containing protein n=1 Tax=Sporothrix bragantina TaxID=671064 RepID=A0ABP0CA73_9PEZI
MAAPATGQAQPPSQAIGAPAPGTATQISNSNVLPALNERRHSSVSAHSTMSPPKPPFGSMRSPPNHRVALAGAAAVAQQPPPQQRKSPPAEASSTRHSSLNGANGTSVTKPPVSLFKDIVNGRATTNAPPTPPLSTVSASPTPAVAKVSSPVPTTASTTNTTTIAPDSSTPKATASSSTLLTENDTKSEPRPIYKMKRTGGRPGFLPVSVHAPNGSRTPTPTSATAPSTPSRATSPTPVQTASAVKAQPKPQAAPQTAPKTAPQPSPRVEIQSSPKSVFLESDLIPQSTASIVQSDGVKRHRESAFDPSLPAAKRLRASEEIVEGPTKADLQAFTISLLSDTGEDAGDSEEDEDNDSEEADEDDEKDEDGEDDDGDDEGDDDTVEVGLEDSDNEGGNVSDDNDGSSVVAGDVNDNNSEILPQLTFTPSGRPYNKYYDKKGAAIPSKGAIIPDGYKLWHEKATPWKGHRASNLNDNLDGTLTVVSRPSGNLEKRLGARVVSQGAPDEKEPLAEPRVKKITVQMKLLAAKAQTVTLHKNGRFGKRGPYKKKQSVKAKASGKSKRILTAGLAKGQQQQQQEQQQPEEDVTLLPELLRSASGREYTRYITGGLAYGVLFPDGYELSTYLGMPWVCPVRDCQCVLPAIHNLGAHFTKKHKFSKFNDNCDGTLSKVGPHSNVKPIVVSHHIKPASQLEPLAEQAPVGYKPKEVVPTEKTNGQLETQPSGVLQTTFAPGRDEMWDYIKNFITEPMRNLGMPNTGKAALFFNAPRVRDVQWNKAIERRNPDVPLHATHLAGLLIQLTGEETNSPCDNCQLGRGLFEGCVLVNSKGTPDMHVAYDGCANCVNSFRRTRCSLRHRLRQRFTKLYPHLDYNKVAAELRPKLYRVESSSTPTVHPTAAAAAAAASAMADSPVNAYEAERKEDMELRGRVSPDTSDNEPLVRGTKLRPREGPYGAGSDRQRSRRRSGRIADNVESAPVSMASARTTSTNANKKSDSPLLVAGDMQPALEMEDWEVAPGRVQATTNENIAFSNAYLTSNQMVPISHGMSYRVEVVRPGSTTTFDADARSTRMCMVASGKLRVTVVSDEFVMGPNGMFLVKPGDTFSVQNRLYIDAYLHIAALHNQQ